jgi:YMGG-like Gly-zipper
MLRRIKFAFVPVIVALMLAQPVAAQNSGRGALGGAAAGALVGGIAAGGRGAAIGALVGAGTGALIGRQGRRARGRYYWWHGNCYYHGRSGRWYRVSQRYCR